MSVTCRSYQTFREKIDIFDQLSIDLLVLGFVGLGTVLD